MGQLAIVRPFLVSQKILREIILLVKMSSKNELICLIQGVF